MQIGIFAKTFAGAGAEAVFTAVRAAGYETAQFNMACVGLPSMPDDIVAETIAEVAKASRASGVAIAAVSATYNMIHPDYRLREEGLRRLGVILRAARGLGTGLVTLCTGTRDAEDQWRYHPDNASVAAWHDLLTEMEKAVALAEDCGIDLGIEPELGNVVSSPQKARRLIGEILSPRVRIVLDPANLFETATVMERRDIVAAAADRLGGHIAMAHAKDRNAKGEVVAAGQGVIDFPHFIACLRDVGFDGPLVTHGLSAAEAPAVAAFLREIAAR